MPGYGDPRGAPSLRTALARYLSAERGLTVGADNILITRGSQMALFLAAAVLNPGDAIAVEDPGYPLAWKAFGADPEWVAARKASEVNGKLTDKVESVIMGEVNYFKAK